MPDSITGRRTVNRAEAQLVYAALSTALDLPLTLDHITALGIVTRDLQAVQIAARTMRKAHDEHGADSPDDIATRAFIMTAGALARHGGRTTTAR